MPALSGCGTAVDDAKVEIAVERNLESSPGKKVASVDCPTGVAVEKGTTFECTVLRRGGGRETATLEILNEDADYRIVSVEPLGGGGEG